MDTPDKHFRRRPQQDRARKAVDAILEATARVVGREGPESATTQRIAHLAGVSVGSLYQYFPAKEALFGALVERAIEDDVRRMDAAVDEAIGMPFEDGVRHCIARVLELPLSRPRLFSWMVRYMPELGLLPAVLRAVHEGVRATRRFLELHRESLDGLDLDETSLFVTGAVRGVLDAVARERPDLLERETFADAMTDLVLGYVDRQKARRAARS